MTKKDNSAAPASDEAKALHDTAKNLIRKRKFSEAEKYLQQSLKISKTAAAYYDLGMLYHANNNVGGAITSLKAAVDTNPNFLPAFDPLLEYLSRRGNRMQLLTYYPFAIKAKPDHLGYKKEFLRYANGFKSVLFDRDFKDALLICMQTPDLDLSGLEGLWLNLLKTDPDFRKLYALSRYKNFAVFQRRFIALKDSPAWHDPFFLAGLKKLVIADHAFERFLTHLRHALLDAPQGHLNLICSLSDYCATVEYIFSSTADEEKKVDTLQSSTGTADAMAIALLSCYRSLNFCADATEISSRFGKSEIASAIQKQITDENAWRSLIPNIETLGQIVDEVSGKVQNQYEEFPYPRWMTFADTIKNEETEGFLHHGKPRILVAGCGTGKEAIELGAVFPNAKILAVDLSRTSLSYAIWRAQSLNIKNITFKNADILSLGMLEDKYDLIACSGVLHHMEESARGLEILNGLLKPGGTMRLALYSSTARRVITKARNIIRKHHIGNGAQDIRQFRKNIGKYLSPLDRRKLHRFRDYFLMSECRDLLFHVQEHQYTTPQIKSLLDQNGLEFSGFYLTDKVLHKYRRKFPTDPTATNLDYWSRFEKRHRNTFIGMYKFWVTKPQGKRR